MPEIPGWAPGKPPCAFKPGEVMRGKLNPNGGVLPVPCWKILPCADAVPPGTNVGTNNPGGFPRNSSCTFALVSQLSNIPPPPRIAQSPFPVGSHAKPIRGLTKPLTACSSALWVAFANPLEICSWYVDPVPR